MYYVELIDRFWILSERVKPGSASIALYLYLLTIAKENNSYQFTISDVELGKRLGLSRATIKTTKGKLMKLGLIRCQSANGVPCNYRLIVNYPLREINGEETLNDIRDAIVFVNENKSRFEIEEQYRPYTADPLSGHFDVSVSGEGSMEKRTVPDIPDFLKYAKTLDAYSPELDGLIKAKYSDWVNNGWKSTSGRFITDWRSSLKNVLPFLRAPGEDQGTPLSIRHIPDIKHPKE